MGLSEESASTAAVVGMGLDALSVTAPEMGVCPLVVGRRLEAAPGVSWPVARVVVAGSVIVEIPSTALLSFSNPMMHTMAK